MFCKMQKKFGHAGSYSIEQDSISSALQLKCQYLGIRWVRRMSQPTRASNHCSRLLSNKNISLGRESGLFLQAEFRVRSVGRSVCWYRL